MHTRQLLLKLSFRISQISAPKKFPRLFVDYDLSLFPSNELQKAKLDPQAVVTSWNIERVKATHKGTNKKTEQ